MIPIRIEIVEQEHPDLARRHLRDAMRGMHQAIGRKWAVDLLPEHFEIPAKSVFQHKVRTWAYQQRKRRLAALGKVQGGGLIDLVFRGTLRHWVLRTAPNTVRAYPSRVTIDVVGPSYLTPRPRNPNRPNMVRELLAVSPRHARQLAFTGATSFERAIQAARASRKFSRRKRITPKAA